MKHLIINSIFLAASALGLSAAALAQSAPTAARPNTSAPAARAPVTAARPATASKGLSRTEFLAGRNAELAQMDTNRDNVLTELEIVTYRVKTAEADAIARNKAAFAGLDADKNGTLSAAEFASMVRPAELPNVKPLIAGLDADRNGSISATEYRNGLAAQFDRMDRNRDGIIDQAETTARPAAPAPAGR